VRVASILGIGLAVGGCRSLIGIDDPVVAAADAPPLLPDVRAPDAPSACRIGFTGLLFDRGRVGGVGGFSSPALTCATGEMVVGIGVRMSDAGVNMTSKRSAHGLVIACASVTIGAAGAVVGAITTFEAMGTGAAGWAPSTLSPPTMCEPGSVVTGLEAKSGGGLLFLDITMACSALTATGVPMASVPRHVDGSLTEASGDSSVTCGAGEALVELAPRTGAGFDSAELSCAATECL
jgi:hypothetical protein